MNTLLIILVSLKEYIIFEILLEELFVAVESSPRLL